MISYGSIFLLAVAHIASVSSDAKGLLYLSTSGELLVCASDDDAPAGAHYVAVIGPDVSPMFVAARLAYVSRFHS